MTSALGTLDARPDFHVHDVGVYNYTNVHPSSPISLMMPSWVRIWTISTVRGVAKDCLWVASWVH